MTDATLQYVRECNGNVENIQALRFGKATFAATLLVSASPDDLRRMNSGLARLAAYNAQLVPAHRPLPSAPDGKLMYEATVYAYESFGIVADVTTIFATNHLDIVQLSGSTYPAPFGAGVNLFVSEFVLEAASVAEAKLASETLHELAKFRSWDVYFCPLLHSGLKFDRNIFPPSRSVKAFDEVAGN